MNELTTVELAAILCRLMEWLEDPAATLVPAVGREATQSAADKVDAALSARGIKGPDDYWRLLGHA